MNDLDDGINNVSDSVGSLDIGCYNGGLGSISIGEGHGGSGCSSEDSSGDCLSSDSLNWSGCNVLGLYLGCDHVTKENLGEGFLVGKECVKSIFVDLGKGGIVGGQNGERSSCNS